MRPIFVVPAILFFVGLSCHAATITLASSAATTTNDSGNPTLDIAKHPGWADPLPGSSWISTAVTGDPADPNYVVFPNNTLIFFSQSFFLTQPVVSASLSVRADDTTSVVVNGTEIFAAANPPGGFPTCSADTIGCLEITTKTFTTADLVPYLTVGSSNTIAFGVVQKADSSYGLNYSGQISDTPEPGTLMIIGAGLCGIALWNRKRAKTTR